VIFIIPLIAIVIGFFLIAFLGQARDVGAAAAEPGAPMGLTDQDAWLARIGGEGFERLLAMLFSEMKFDVQRHSLSGAGLVDLYASNPTPITGMRIYVRGVYAPPLGVVGEEEVRLAIDTARAEHVGKGIVVTPGGYSAEARAAAEGASVDLIDGAALAKLVRKHLPQVAAARSI
jgi:hypothetical protein